MLDVVLVDPRPNYTVGEVFDPSLNAVHASPQPGRANWFVLRCLPNAHNLGEGLAGLPASWLNLVRSGAGGILIDCSAEGPPHDPRRSREWHEALAKYAISPSQVVFVSTNVAYERDYLAFCDQHQIIERVGIVYYHWFLKHLANAAEAGPDEAAWLTRRTERRFLSLNYKLRPYRTMFLLSLLKDRLFDEGFVSFGGLGVSGSDASPAETALRDLATIPLGRELVGEVEALSKLAPIVLDEPSASGQRAMAADISPTYYLRSWITAVTETEMSPAPRRITEKAFKPAANFHPFIVFGNPHSLRALRERGLRTFDGLIDERYDDIMDPEDRFRAAYAEFNRLALMPEDEIAGLIREAWPALRHNAEYVRGGNLRANLVTSMDAPLLARLAA